MTSSLLGISITGLKASQSALSTTGHNIANADVEGYSRQKVETQSVLGTQKEGGFLGSGVSIASIDRVADEFIVGQLRTDTALFQDLDIYYNNITEIDKLLADPESGLAGALESFFAAVQNGTDDPTSIPARQLIISEANNMADRFNTINSRFNVVNDGVNEGSLVGI